MAYISKKIFSCFLGLCVALFFGLPVITFAYTQDFDDYANNTDLATIQTWLGGTVNNTRYHDSSPNSAIDFTIQHDNFGNLTSMGYQIDVYVATTTSQRLLYNWSDNPGVPTGRMFVLTSNANTLYWGHDSLSTNLMSLGAFSANEWHTLAIIFDCSTDTWSIKIDDGSYQSNHFSLESEDDCDYVGHLSNSTNANIFYDNYHTTSYLDNENIDAIDSNPWATVQVGLADGIQFPLRTTCLKDSDCQLEYNYGYPRIGDKLFLYNYNSFQAPVINPNTGAIASTTLPNSVLLKGAFAIDSTVATTSQYCFYSMTGLTVGSSDIYGCGIYVDVVEDDYLTDLLNQFECDCDDIATSTGIFDEFRYGIECGLRKTGCFFLKPNNSSIGFYQGAVTNLTNQFPFSVHRQLKERFETYSASSTAITMAGVFPDQGGENYIFADPTDIENKWGDTLVTVRNSIGYLLYFLLILYFLREVVTHFGRTPEE